MMRRIGLIIILCGSLTVVGSACATKSYVAERVGATEGRLAAQVQSTEARLGSTEAKLTSHDQQMREATERMKSDRVAIATAADLASGAKSAADAAMTAARDAEARLAQRIAERNRFRLLETRDIHFNSGRADIRRDDTAVLDDMAQKLKDDVNAVLELRGFADPLGSDQYNNQLTRDRVDAVIRYFLHGHGIELRQLRAAAMGKTALGAGVQPGPDVYASARRVEMRLLTPWSSSEDRQSGADTQDDDAVAASPATAVPWPVGPPTPASASGDLLTREAWRDIVNGITPRDLGAAD